MLIYFVDESLVGHGPLIQISQLPFAIARPAIFFSLSVLLLLLFYGCLPFLCWMVAALVQKQKLKHQICLFKDTSFV